MKKILGTAALLMTSLSAHAEVVRLHVTTHLHDGVPFPELGQCFLSAAEPRDVEGDDVLIDLKAGPGNKRIGSWKKAMIIDNRQVEYRLTAIQAPNAKLKVRAQIVVDGMTENSGALDLDGEDQWGFPVNFLEATLTNGQASCHTANITVVKVEKAFLEDFASRVR